MVISAEELFLLLWLDKHETESVRGLIQLPNLQKVVNNRGKNQMVGGCDILTFDQEC
jgi:hypothetical protein